MESDTPKILELRAELAKLTAYLEAGGNDIFWIQRQIRVCGQISSSLGCHYVSKAG